MKKMKMLFPVFVLCASLLLPAMRAEASKQIVLNNSSSRKISVCVVVNSYNGWRVIGWYGIAPWSYKRINFNDAGGQHFGVYAHSGNIQWSGNNNQPAVYVTSDRMNHDARQVPYGNNVRQIRVRMVNGNSYKFTWKGDQQQMPRQQSGGWW